MVNQVRQLQRLNSHNNSSRAKMAEKMKANEKQFAIRSHRTKARAAPERPGLDFLVVGNQRM